MRIRLVFQLQFLLAVVFALLCGWLLGAPRVDATTSQPLVSPGDLPPLFTNVSGVWMVRVRINRTEAPQILEVVVLDEGRLSATQGGDNRLYVVDAVGNVLFTLEFHAQFSAPDFGATVNDVEKLLIIPAVQDGKMIVVTSPQGETSYEFPTR